MAPTCLEWVSTVGSLVAGVGGLAAVVLAVKSINLTKKSMAAAQAAQMKIDTILDDDRRYKDFVDRHVARGLHVLRSEAFPSASGKRQVDIDEPDVRYLARALREGVFEPGNSRNMYWVTK